MTNNQQIFARFEHKENLSILVVDDNPSNLKMVASILKPEGYNIAMANSGEKAIKFTEDKLPDLILLDIMMPKMDGYETCKILKENELTAHIPIMFLTARNDTDDIIKAFQLGGVDYITKPFKTEEILARIKNILLLKISQDIINEQNQMLKASQKSIYDDAVKILELNNKLTESERDLKELNNTKDKFFSIIGHDLKSQFAGILGLAEVLHRYGTNISTQDRDTYIGHIFDGLTQMRSFLENILEWALSQTGQINFLPNSVQLERIFKDIMLQYHNNAFKKNITICNDVDSDIRVYADENMLMTIIRNLVSNAIKYTNVGGTIILSAEEGSHSVEIFIKDDGIGMTPKMSDKLFKIGNTNQSSPGTENEKGTGLGLLLCKDFAQRHGGDISVISEINKGSTFIVTLPKK